ncbi:MAG: hypothetical protein AAGG38_15105 [Planctomycetota bacterium]
MKNLLAAFIVLVFLHLILAVGFVGWLGATNRIDPQRIQAAVDLFTPTLEQQAQREAEVRAAAEQAAAARDQLMRLNAVSQGPQTIEERLMENFEADEFDLHRLERLNTETQAIRRRLDQDKALIAEELADLEAREKTFAQLVARRTAEMQDEDFRRAVKTLEQLPPKQGKGVIENYLAQGRVDDAVDYLAAMQLRKSAGILKAFKTQPELAQAAMLIQKLRERGQDPFARAQPDAPESPTS